jgi:hypothetical protein
MSEIQEEMKPFFRAREIGSSCTMVCDTPFGEIFFKLVRASHADSAEDRSFPYGITYISQNGALPSDLLRISVRLEEDRPERRHYFLTLHLPGIGAPYVGGDVMSPGTRGKIRILFFVYFYREDKLKTRLLQTRVIGNVKKISDSGAYKNYGGVIYLHDDLRIIKNIRVTIREISEEERKIGPWSFLELMNISYPELYTNGRE